MRSLPVPAGVDEVTPEWLSLLFGPVESLMVEEIGGDFGLSGTTFRLDLGLADGRSSRVVVKFAAAAPTAREVTFYEQCAASAPLRLPKFIGGAVDREADRGVVLLEYLADVRQGDVLVGCTRDEALTLAKMLARLHATWWGADHPALAALADLGNDPLTTAPSIREGRLSPFLDRHGASLSPSMREVVAGLPARLPWAHQELVAGPMTLVHRDYHLDNVLFPLSGEPFVIDWQGAAAGPPAVDVARFMVECMTSEQRRLHGTEGLSVDLDRLEAGGIRPEPNLRHQIVLALLRLLAGTINWLGRTPPDPAGSRKQALGRNILRNITETIATLSSGDL